LPSFLERIRLESAGDDPSDQREECERRSHFGYFETSKNTVRSEW
jgi:hypothetical protein